MKSFVFTFSTSKNEQKQEVSKDLLKQAKSGNQSAFAELYDLFFKKIYRFIYFRVSHKEVAEDLTEDVFIRAYSKLPTQSESSSFEGWLYQIARNRVIDYYREKKISVPLDGLENTLQYESNIVDDLELLEDQAILLKLIKELPNEQQTVIKLKFYEQLDNPEIAEIMQKSEGAIRVIQHRAIIKLQQLFQELNQQHEK